MKKNQIEQSDGLKIHRCKIFLIMKMTLILLICFVFNLRAAVNAQHQVVSLRLNNVSLGDAIRELKKQTSLDFFFSNKELDVNNKVTLEVQEMKLDAVLQQLLGDAFLCEFMDNMVIIKPINRNFPYSPQKKVQVTGVVKDKQGEILPGVAVLIKGTSLGVTTDANGRFTLTVPEVKDMVLVFTCIGMKPHEVVYKKQTDIKIVMETAVTEMEEVVVTGIHERKKESFTGSASTFKGEQLKMVSNQNILQGLRTLDPAFAIIENNQNGSDPNKLPDIEIRGKSSFVGFKETFGEDPNQPLFILDGFETKLEVIMDLSMDRVGSLTILKDAASTAIYGAKAANGVIVIETKNPEKGKLRVSYNGNFDVSMADLSDYNLMNAQEKLEFEMLAERQRFENGWHVVKEDMEKRYNRLKADIARGVDTYWLSELLRVGFNHRHNLYVEGGDGQMRYGVGVNYNSTQGVMKQSGKEIFSGNIDLLYRVNKVIFSNKFTIEYKNNEDPTVPFSKYAEANPYYRKRDENGEMERRLEFFDRISLTGQVYLNPYDVENPLWNASLNSFNKGKNIEFRNNFQIEWTIIDNLKLRGRLGITKSNKENENFLSPEHSSFDKIEKSRKGSYQDIYNETFSYETDVTLNYGVLLNGKHQLNAIAGVYVDSDNGDYKSYSAVGFPVGNYITPSFSTSYTPNSKPVYEEQIKRSASIYLNGGYAYHNRYLLDFNIRADGSSVFGSNKRYTSTWAVGLGWNVYNEQFIRNTTDVIDILRIRASIGNPGNQNFGNVQTFTTYQFNTWLSNGFGLSALVDGYGNSDLEWQKTLDKNVGLDLSMFGNKFHVTLDYYHKNTKPLLAEIGIPSSVGVKTMFSNVGNQIDQGINGTIKYSPLYRPAERKNYTISLNFRINNAEYSHVGNSLEQFNKKNQTNSKSLTRYYDGGSPTALWAVRSKGIDPASGKEIFIKKDGTYSFVYDYTDEVVVGDSRPKIEGVIGNSLFYKGFSCSLQIRYSLGGDQFNDALYNKVENISSNAIKTNQDKRALSDRWKKAGDVAKFKNISMNEYTPISSRFVEKNNYFSIESVRVGYEFEQPFIKRMGISRLGINAYMNDIVRVSSIKNERGIAYPFARTLSFALSVNF